MWKSTPYGSSNASAKFDCDSPLNGSIVVGRSFTSGVTLNWESILNCCRPLRVRLRRGTLGELKEER